jgi:uncharacterized phage-like protein YoqJ
VISLFGFVSFEIYILDKTKQNKIFIKAFIRRKCKKNGDKFLVSVFIAA